MNIQQRISALEKIQQVTKWPGRMIIIHGKDSVSVIKTDINGQRIESEIPASEFQEPKHENKLIIK